MDPQFEELAQRLKEELAQYLKSELTTVVADQFTAAEGRLVGQYRIHAEEIKAEVKLAAEGYGATLDAINRRLQELETKWDTRIYDHERILDVHNQRITVLEKER